MISNELSDLRIVLLAAGFSTRMGRSKTLVTVRGVSLIRRTVAVLAQFAANNIVVVTSPRATRLRAELRGYPVTLLANPQRARGLSSSVMRALRETRYGTATLLLPADLGELKPRDIARLISRWRSAKRRVTARRLDGRASTPLILPKWLYPQARRLIGDVGLRALIAALPEEQRMLVELSSAVRDVDTPDDLAAARRARAPMIRVKSRLRYIR
jgi:molybdenum cofactor cytidylyltransferase